MNESRGNDVMEPAASHRRGGVHTIAEALEELMEQYLARFSEWTDIVPEEEALAV